MTTSAQDLTRADAEPTVAPDASPAAVRRWACLGLAAQVAFVAGFLIAASWQGPRYSPLAHSISDTYADTAPMESSWWCSCHCVAPPRSASRWARRGRPCGPLGGP